jgi:AraC family transcriptional regulator
VAYVFIVNANLTPLTSPGRHLLAGHLSEPRLSSAAQGWRGIMLEVFPAGQCDFTGMFENHGITLYLNGCMDLYQRFEGKVSHTQMRRGNIIISPAEAPKTFQYQGDSDFLVVHIAPVLLLRLAEEMKGSHSGAVEVLNQFCVRDVQIESLARQLWHEYQTHDLASGICAESLASQFAVHVLRHYSNIGKTAQAPSSKLSAQALKRAVDYIEANLSNDLTVAELARALSMSAGHFAHAFKSTTGIAPHRYVIERRLELAKSLLRQTQLPISAVAMRSGFTTQSHFSVTFQNLTAQTPSAFRRTQ